MTPTASLLAADAAIQNVVDAEGRRLSIRRLNALDRLRLFKAAGPVLAQNQPWLGMALIASSVTSINDIPTPPPVTEAQVEVMIGRLGDAGIAAIAAALQPMEYVTSPELTDNLGNSAGTPT